MKKINILLALCAVIAVQTFVIGCNPPEPAPAEPPTPGESSPPTGAPGGTGGSSESTSTDH